VRVSSCVGGVGEGVDELEEADDVDEEDGVDEDEEVNCGDGGGLL